MSTTNMRSFFHPESITVIGASGNPVSLGFMVMKNLMAAGFAGPIMPVNPKYESVSGVLTYPTVAELPRPAELAIICTPPAMIPDLIEALGRQGTRASVILTAGLDAPPPTGGLSLQEQALQRARQSGMRLLGPNCLGLLVPGSGINGSFAHTGSLAGSLAFVSQSGALSTSVLDWAKSGGIGFSCFVSLGNSIDVNFSDTIEYLADDDVTSAILLYIEAIRNGPGFMNAATLAARKKPIIAIKSGRVPDAQKAAASHTGALAGSDEVYEAAFRRAGILRVDSFEDLFGAVETLGKAKPLHGDGLSIVSNGGGPGVMATDSLVLNGGRLARFSKPTFDRLNDSLPANWSRANPIDIIGDAPPERYVQALKILLEDEDTAAVLFIHAPSAIVPSDIIAGAMLETAAGSPKTVFTCWLGRDGVARARALFSDRRIPCFDTPEDAVHAFLDMTRYRKGQSYLAGEETTPPAVSLDRTKIGACFASVRADRRNELTEPEAKQVLAAAGLPVITSRIAADPAACVVMAREIGFPIVLKIISPQISHKSDVGGVALNLESDEQVAAAAEAMSRRVRSIRPDAELTGFSVQQMVKMPSSHELIIGATRDASFGPVIMFGHGGTAVEVIRDHAMALPPITRSIAADMVSQTRVSRLLAGYRDRPKANMEAIYQALIQLSQLVLAFPEIKELDVNPLLANDERVTAIDARIKLE
ncbi:MAG: acetate--CoA ligase family protein [Opitutaceae bacterium]